MAEFNVPAPGSICWRELATRDLPAAMEFYSKLFGWSLPQTKITPMEYKEIVMDDVAYGGMMAMDENWPADVPTHWTSYIAVKNADETAEKITSNGGTVRVPPFDAPGVGRLSLVADPDGAAFAIIQFTQPM